jgi:hypothetical protein
LCCEALEKVEYDHKMPLADGGGHGEDNIQALCPPCHADKSRGERLTTFANAWYSELSQDVLEGLLDAPKPQQLVFGDGTKNCMELDVVKCRRYAIEKADGLPVACILDSIVPYSGPADFVFIDAGPPDTTNYANFVAYQGPRWVTWELAMWIVEQGVRSQTPITTDHFIASFTASSHVPASKIRAVYSDMEGTLVDALEGKTLEGFSYPDGQAEAAEDVRKKNQFFKTIILAMQGSWLTQHHYSWKVVESPCMDDAPGQVTKFEDMEDHHGTMRWRCRSEILKQVYVSLGPARPEH